MSFSEVDLCGLCIASGCLFAGMLDKAASVFMCGLPCSRLAVDAVMAPGVKQTLRLDVILKPVPCVCVLDLLEPGS